MDRRNILKSLLATPVAVAAAKLAPATAMVFGQVAYTGRVQGMTWTQHWIPLQPISSCVYFSVIDDDYKAMVDFPNSIRANQASVEVKYES